MSGYTIIRVNEDCTVTVLLDIDGRELQEDVEADGFDENVKARLVKFGEDLAAAAERLARAAKIEAELPVKIGDRVEVK